MQYVALLTFRDSLSAQERNGALTRRATYQFPANFKQVAEYWTGGQPEVIVVFECDTFDPIFKLTLDWQDVFQIAIHPTTTAEAGLQMGQRLMGGG